MQSFYFRGLTAELPLDFCRIQKLLANKQKNKGIQTLVRMLNSSDCSHPTGFKLRVARANISCILLPRLMLGLPDIKSS
ncbi:hypothetical protein BpHYR1_002149 [Brachionus plicatilis]|uniref:Uncharacterized protein n=1 Tax=Brachionus plicatilis TaxID=10195 RepID=A0A3M7R103_BRAPC|nr:hypothetical protein BpHYR1_002149 [Brachionus plicatilis]